MHITPKNILIYTLIATLALYIIENVYHPVYLIQIMQKVMTFLVIPLLI
jgi:hypothetical protein